MRHLQLLLLGTVLLVVVPSALAEPVKSPSPGGHSHASHGHGSHGHGSHGHGSHGHGSHDVHHHHGKKHSHHHAHHHSGVYGFGDPFESNGRWLPEEDDTCNCELIVLKMKRLREKVLTALSSFDKLLTVLVDLRQIKNLLKNIDLSLTTLGGHTASSESQMEVLADQTSAISMAFSRAKAAAVQLITKESLINFIGSAKSSTEEPPLGELEEVVYQSCQDRRIYKTGVYKVSVNLTKSMYMLCSLDFGQNAWTVVQNRFDGSENFFRPWNHYKAGFGTFGHGEYWLGLENIHAMMEGREHELLILLEDFDGKFAYAKYKYFRIEGEKHNFKMSKLHGYIGTAGNSLQDAEGMMFSTYDKDHDKSADNCAQKNHGAWWYRACGDSNLNGAYRKEYSHDFSGLFWKEFRGLNYSLKRSRIMIRNKKGPHHSHQHHHHAHDQHHGYHRIEGAGAYEDGDYSGSAEEDTEPTAFEKAF